MASIGEITQGASYTGAPQLGGGLAVGVALDSSPLQRLANYNFYKDRDMWEQKKKDDATAATAMADITAYDTSSPFKQYTDDLKGELSTIQEYVRANPDALVYSRNPQKFAVLQEMKNRFNQKRKAATANDIIYNSQKAAIEKTADPSVKQYYQDKMNSNIEKQFAGGLENAYNTQFGYIDELKPEDYELPTVAPTTRSFLMEGANKDINIEVTYNDPEDLETKSIIATEEIPDITQETWFQNMPENEKKLALQRNAVLKGKSQVARKTADSFQQALSQLQATSTTPIDFDTMTEDQMKTLPDIIKNNVKQVQAYNKNIAELNSMIDNGKIKDKTGVVRTEKYRPISLKDGLQAHEVAMLKSVQASKTPFLQKVEKAATYHKTAQGYAEIEERRQGRKATGGGSGGGGAVIENPARAYKDHVNTVKNYYAARPELKENEYLTVPVGRIDENTRLALGIKRPLLDQYANEEARKTAEKEQDKILVAYKKDGTAVVGVTENDDGSIDITSGRPVTRENLKQGYIDVTRGSLQEKGTLTQGFEEAAEQGFKNIFGSNDANAIWEGTVQQQPQQTGVPGEYTSITTKKDPQGNIIQIGVKNGKWYNTQTGQPL